MTADKDLGALISERVIGFSRNNEIRQLYNESLQRAQDGAFDTPLKQLRYYILHQLCAAAVLKHPDLSMAECGCWWGHSTHILGSIVADQPAFTGKLHVFDSFEGLSEFKPEDKSSFRPTEARENAARKHFKSDFQLVSKRLSRFRFVQIHPGWIPTGFSEVEGETFSLVTIDVDLYEPTRDSLRFFYPRIREGGFLYFDDYGYETFPGAKRAVDEYLADQNPRLFLEMPFGSAFLIK
jgi:O-methyltransferase